MLLSPTATNIGPAAAYAGSTITVTGSQFSHPCTAKVVATPSSGIAATSCSYVSATALLVVIATGTPEGVGFSRKPPRFLQKGDFVEVIIDKIGTLRNIVY
jgi:hypothetical protein